MRPFEWLLLFSFLPALLPFHPQRWRRQWRFATTLLPMAAGILQVISEGWRAQLIPLYLLAVLIVPIALWLARRPAQRRAGLLVRSLVGVGLLLCGLLAGWALPVLILPTPTGPYPVGIVDRELVDEARARRLMVSVWYPAAEAGPPAPLTHYPDAVQTGLGRLTGLPALLFQHLRYSTVAASEGVPARVDTTPFPVLVFSHGMVGLRLQSSPLLQELASWGYVVVALDHTDAAMVTVLPDGAIHFYNMERFGMPANVEPNQELVTEHVLPVWIADQRLIYEVLEQWASADPLLAGKLDLARIGSFGHSFGGATALEVCRVEVRCRAAVNLDGGLYGESITQPAVRPLLLMSSADSRQYEETVAEWRHLIARATDAAYWLELPGSDHLSFTITPLLSPLLAPQGFDTRAGFRTVDKYLRRFFDTYLRGIDTAPLGPAAGETDVHWLPE